MWVERFGKAGGLCQPAREGQLRCPLIVRQTSEDVLVGHLFQSLHYLNPSWWLPDILNGALRAPRFRRQFFRNFRIELWKNRPWYPRTMLPWNEGSTQVDVTLAWENPPTTVFIEAKYTAELSAKTARNNGQHGYPSDQFVRTIRVGLLETGWFQAEELFDHPPRDFVCCMLGISVENPLVAKYRDPAQVMAAIPQSDRLKGLPGQPFVGEISYPQIARHLRERSRFMNRTERVIAEDLVEYLDFKQSSRLREASR